MPAAPADNANVSQIAGVAGLRSFERVPASDRGSTLLPEKFVRKFHPMALDQEFPDADRKPFSRGLSDFSKWPLLVPNRMFSSRFRTGILEIWNRSRGAPTRRLGYRGAFLRCLPEIGAEKIDDR
jgi:hypothetical protein